MKNKILELGYPISEVNELIKVSKDINKDYMLLKNHYPIQYCIGYVNFHNNKILVNKNVLIPRYETEILVDKLIGYIKNRFTKKVNVLDLCTGSGAIAISIEKQIDSFVDASDISTKAISLAKNNSKINGSNINFIVSDIFENINDKYDVIVANPPYISKNETIEDSVYNYEPHIALFAEDDGLYFYEQIISKIKKHLNNQFIIAFEIGYNQAGSIKKIINNYLCDVDVIVEKDYSNKDRYIFVLNK